MSHRSVATRLRQVTFHDRLRRNRTREAGGRPALARRTGESKTDAVIKAVRDRLARIRGGRSLVDELEEIAERCSRLPVRDRRSADEILGYGDDGLPR